MKQKGEITVYLSLTFILLLTLVGALIESAAIQTLKNRCRADVNRALECVFAEYQIELLEEYDVFALESTYETGNYSEEHIMERMNYYAGRNIKSSIERIQFLSDDSAKAFYEQVLCYMEHRYGLEGLEEQAGITEVWKSQEEDIEVYESIEEESQDHLDQLLEENEKALPEDDNPISYVDELKQMSVLNLVMPKEKAVSEKSLELSEVMSHRECQKGYGDFSDMEKDTGTLSTLMFGQYVLDHFGNATDSETGNVLEYEVEYILAGKSSDHANLENVVKKLLLLRFVPNYAFLQGNPQKKAEAEALALTLSSIFAVPAITEAVAQVILLAWAYGEAIMDLRTLLADGKVPLTKTESTWQLSLSGLMKLKEQETLSDGADTENGMRYEEYLRILLFLSNKETITKRTLDVIEQNLQKVHGKEFFRVDQCVTKLEVRSEGEFRRGITYEFSTYFGYN